MRLLPPAQTAAIDLRSLQLPGVRLSAQPVGRVRHPGPDRLHPFLPHRVWKGSGSVTEMCWAKFRPLILSMKSGAILPLTCLRGQQSLTADEHQGTRIPTKCIPKTHEIYSRQLITASLDQPNFSGAE